MALVKIKPVETINISSDFLFDFDKYNLRPDAAGVLTQIAEKVRSKPVSVSITGHTDTYGSDAYNRLLSAKRAGIVKAFLVSQGINAPIEASGVGESEPIVTDCSLQPTPQGIACQAKNRRVVIQITQN